MKVVFQDSPSYHGEHTKITAKFDKLPELEYLNLVGYGPTEIEAIRDLRHNTERHAMVIFEALLEIHKEALSRQ